jgi:predicted DNA-binding transcriptional regulator AlpA
MAGRSRARTVPSDFIDRVQAAKLLGLNYAEAIYRVRAQAGPGNPFPAPVRRIVNSDVWSATQLQLWRLRAEGKFVPRKLEQRAANTPAWPDYALDREQVAALLGISPSTVSRYASEAARQPVFPPPLVRFAGHPVWHRDDVLRWQRARPGRYGAPRGVRHKGTCGSCGWARVLRTDGKVVRHTWSPKGKITECPGGGELPAPAIPSSGGLLGVELHGAA